MYRRAPCGLCGVLVLLAIAGSLSPAHAYLELGLSWDAAVLTDTLTVSHAGEYEIYVLIEPDIGDTVFGSFWGPIVFSSGVSFVSIEGLLGEGGLVTAETAPEGYVIVHVDYRGECIFYDNTLAFARIVVAVDPTAFPESGVAAVIPFYVPGGANNTRINVGSTECFFFDSEWPAAPVFIISAAVPTAENSFGGLKALYR